MNPDDDAMHDDDTLSSDAPATGPLTAEEQVSVDVIVQRVGLSRRYRGVDVAVISRVARGVLAQSSSLADAEKRTKRRLHQMFGAYTGVPEYARHLLTIQHAWRGDLQDRAFRDSCRLALSSHASTRERLPLLDRFYDTLWSHTGQPNHVLDLACGLSPLAFPWMNLPLSVRYDASDIDQPLLSLVSGFLDVLGVAHQVGVTDLVTTIPTTQPIADVALLLKTVPPLDQQDAGAAARLLRGIPARVIVLSFPTRSLGGHARGMSQNYRARAERLLAECADVVASVQTQEFAGELVYIVTRRTPDAAPPSASPQEAGDPTHG